MIRKKMWFVRKLAIALLVVQVFELFAPSVAYALTSGPTAPEVQTFEPAGTTEMVDDFTGDFTYNVPLFELPGPNGGYPFNIAYNSGATMDQEASWVGLGWNLNPGAILRNKRGLPDDFNGAGYGDIVTNKYDMKTNWTLGFRGGVNYELAGGDFGKLASASISLGGSIYVNSYRGVGYSIDLGTSLSAPNSTKTKASAGLGLNLSLDSQEGVGGGASLSLSAKDKEQSAKSTSLSIGIGFNSRRGLGDLTLSASRSSSYLGSNDKVYSEGMSGSSSISFAATTYTPAIDMPMSGSNLSLNFKAGASQFLNFPAFYIGGYYTEQHVKNKGKDVKTSAFGYNNFANDDNALLDFNREKDGVIRDETPNLGVPSMTYDIYTIQGQGVGGMFRPYRSDVGTLFDKYDKSESGGGGVGVELGGGAASVHVGVDANFNYSYTEVGKWDQDVFDFIPKGEDGAYQPVGYQPYYYKVHGEFTSEQDPQSVYQYMGDNQTVRVKVSGGSATNELVNKTGGTVVASSGRRNNRKPVNQVVQSFRNEQLKAGALKQFNVKIFDATAPSYTGNLTTLNRVAAGMPDSHDGGFSVLDANGSRYVYGLPVYNNEEFESLHSVDGPLGSSCNTASATRTSAVTSDKYLHETKTSKYTTSFLLTSIVGADYVDINDDGPSDEDFGYWVKFNYVKVNDNYGWRAPFYGSSFNKGEDYYSKDDKGTYMYGKKEMYYLATAETKTHIAVFKISKRHDARGANNQLQSTSFVSANVGAYSYKLDAIELYTKEEYNNASASPKPIQVTHFSYDYSLCKGVENNHVGANTELGTNDGGKLTLKAIWYTYGTSARGELNKYKFSYGFNPDYEKKNQDRWGCYKLIGANCKELDFPYTKQHDNDGHSVRTDADQNASAWNLNEIETPTGGSIHVSYETDDYAYVQNKAAGQMFNIAGLNNVSSHEIYSSSWDAGNPNQRKVFFNLEEPISSTDLNRKQLLNKYFDDLKSPDGNYQLYYKLRIKLRQSDETVEDYISGYAYFQENNWGFGPDIDGKHKTAWVILDLPKISDKTIYYHPFALAGWQFMRNNMPELLSSPFPITADAGSSEAELQAHLGSLFSILPEIGNMFRGFHKSCFDKRYSRDIDLDYSVIRLCTPDRIKYGGGCRVKSIIIKDDSWVDDDKPAEYGMVYSYTMDEKVGTLTRQISSGVAAYEPIVGGDEISLRFARTYPEHIPLKTDNELFFEYPVNESYFPGPTVGYSKITVRSLASSRKQKTVTDALESTNADWVPREASTGGMVVKEFYTAKDFPVITDQTELYKEPYHLYIPLPFIGALQFDDLTASQGYKIELNDMHGKPKSVVNYALDKDANPIVDKPVSSVYYKYKFVTDGAIVNGKKANILSNTVPVLTADGAQENREMGVEYEFFTDMRKARNFSTNGGISINLHQEYILPFPLPWPSISLTDQKLYTAATNKIIHRAGIMTEVVASDGESVVSTQNVLFDGVTGRALLTTVKNNFDDLVYDYKMPAMWAYAGMGSAYQDIGITYNDIDYTDAGTNLVLTRRTSTAPLTQAEFPAGLDEGDELLINVNTYGYQKAYVYKVDANNATVELMPEDEGGFTNASSGKINTLEIIRSSKRNLLNADAGQIKALKNPLVDRHPINCNTNIEQPVIKYVTEYVAVVETTYWESPATECRVALSDAANAAQGLFNTMLNKNCSYCACDVLPKWCDNQQPPHAYVEYYKPPHHPRHPYHFLTSMDIVCPTQSYPCQAKVGRYNYIYNDIVAACRDRSGNNGPEQDITYQTNFSLETNDDFQRLKELAHGTPCASANLVYMNYITDLIEAGTNFNMPYLAEVDYMNPLMTHPFFKSCTPAPPGYLGLNRNCSAPDIGTQFPWTSTSHGIVDEVVFTPYTYDCTSPAEDKAKVKVVATIRKNSCSQETETLIAYFDEVFCMPATKEVVTEVPGVVHTPVYTTVLKPVTKAVVVWEACPLPPLKTIDQVLSASAATYKENWINNSNALNNEQKGFIAYKGANSYASGERGIWKVEKTYTYVDDRKQSNPVNVRTDGTFDGMPLFNWANPFYKECENAAKWRLTNTVTAYSPYNYEIENKDILDNYSAAVYGYNGKQAIAVASNAKESEIGFVCFEDYGVGANNNTDIAANLQFAQSYTYPTPTAYTYDVNEIVIGGGSVLQLDRPYNASETIDEVKVEAYVNGGSKLKVYGVEDINNENGRTQLILDEEVFDPSLCFVGKVYIKKDYVQSSATTASTITQAQAHTGKRSIKLNANTVDFVQKGMKLQPLRKYVVSAWVKADGLQQYTYAGYGNYQSGAAVTIKYSNSSTEVRFYPKGEIIDGWQRIEGEFTAPSNIASGNLIIALEKKRNGSSALDTYFDDIRLFPSEGNMKSYVYDLNTMRLNAVLDDNNYAALYRYDEEGKLYLTQKETEVGVQTIQESRSYIKKQ